MSAKQLEKIEKECAVCNNIITICLGTYQAAIKRNGFYRCKKCSPQRTKNFWENKERKLKHSTSIKKSEKYYIGLANRASLTGIKNGMFGKKHSSLTKSKMSKSRIGKIGENATNWQGGKSSFCKRIKRLIYTRYNWIKRIIERDGHKCVLCGATKRLEVHHIDPVVKIIKRIIKDYIFKNEDEKVEFVINHPEIKDDNLLNGVLVCRSCHKLVHKNWGSHVSP